MVSIIVLDLVMPKSLSLKSLLKLTHDLISNVMVSLLFICLMHQFLDSRNFHNLGGGLRSQFKKSNDLLTVNILCNLSTLKMYHI
jgi:hypothetical protein